jgi:anti-sigma factor RsiW
MRSPLRRLMTPFIGNCDEVREQLTDYVEGDIEVNARKRVDRHLHFCSACSQVLANLRYTLERLRRLGAAPAGSTGEAELAQRLRARWRERAHQLSD